ncbi:MAG: exo-alpha-sialidase [Anaerolineae bacterium]|nr:exo-alpha-sialidase [Anaerolineae bacterium]
MRRSAPIFAPTSTIPSCHAATLVELANGHLLAAWFGGTHEGHPDVAIWMARYDGAAWSDPVVVVDEPGVPLWNPVLFRDRTDTLWLFYKAGPHVPAWTGRYTQSRDGGHTWSAPVVLPAGLVGPAKNKPLALSNGDILCGSSSETWRSWACWVEISTDRGHSWSRRGPIVAPAQPDHRPPEVDEPVSAVWDAASRTLIVPQGHAGVIQPTVSEYAPGRLHMLMRATRRVGYVCAAHSDDYGQTWSAASVTDIPCPNSGLDAVRLADGRLVLACNPTHEGRTPLSLLTSEDNGATWPHRLDLETEPGEYSYPSIIQAADGRVHVAYTWRRTCIQHVVLGPGDLYDPS